MNTLQQDILKTLLYYDVFGYPLKAAEVFSFLPSNSITLQTLSNALDACVSSGKVFSYREYFSVLENVAELVHRRQKMEAYAERRWKIAHLVAHIVKRFPFVRGCFVTGTLSKNISAPECDIDLFIVTKENRLWITRSLLILFKKIFLFNSNKYFCANYFVSEDALEIHEHNIFTAMEIAHVKPLLNKDLFDRFVLTNQWIKKYFPNWDINHMRLSTPDDKGSLLARSIELLFSGAWADAFDDWLLQKMKQVWKYRYPELTDKKRNELFRAQKQVSTAHGVDAATKILNAYKSRCDAYGLPYSFTWRI
jgi:hypothetical protein